MRTSPPPAPSAGGYHPGSRSWASYPSCVLARAVARACSPGEATSWAAAAAEVRAAATTRGTSTCSEPCSTWQALQRPGDTVCWCGAGEVHLHVACHAHVIVNSAASTRTCSHREHELDCSQHHTMPCAPHRCKPVCWQTVPVLSCLMYTMLGSTNSAISSSSTA
jgi:hypothetical protein